MNTPNKRASAIGIGLAIRLVLPIPDGAIGPADRQHVAYSYAGIQAANPIPIPNQTVARGVLVSPVSMAIDVECRALSDAIDVTDSAVSAAAHVKVT